MTTSTRDQVTALESAIAAQPPISSDTVVYRGIGAETGATYREMQPGDTFREPGFSSTTTDEQYAGKFFGATNEPYMNPTTGLEVQRHAGDVLEIHAPAGSQGLSVNDVVSEGSHPEEHEVVLAPDSEFKVLEQQQPGLVGTFLGHVGTTVVELQHGG
jgi:hypothetical protein